MASQLQKEINKLSSLKEYKDKPEDYVKKIAQKNITLDELIESGNFVDTLEKKRAKLIFEKYLESKDFTDSSELSTLSMLVYNRILVERIQKSINNQKNKEGIFLINDKLAKSLHDAENQTLLLEKNLGLDSLTSVENDLTALQRGKKQFHAWIQYNRHEYSTVCSNCGFPLLLRRKCEPKFWEVIKHPFFSGRWYYNHRAMQDVKNGKLTKEQYADYFHTSVDYVDWCLKNEGMILAINDIPKQDMQKFMKEKWYLKDFADKISD